MSPLTHLLASWIVAAKTTDNLRDRALVTLAGVAPDLDGLGVIIDIGRGALTTGHWYYYQKYHHWLGHGLPAALLCAVVLAVFARRRWRTFGLALIVFHLHLLCDLAGSRGPEATDFWPIFYFGPFSSQPMWIWKQQWALDAWPNRVITVALVFWSLGLAAQKGDSVVGVFSRRADRKFVGVLRKWCSDFGLARKSASTF